jgi:hypothetical protein
MCDSQTSRQKIERELQRLEIHVALGVLEPLQADLCCTLQALHCRSPLGFVRGERRRDVLMAPESAYQCDRIFDRELRSRADREMRRVRRIAKQDDVLVRPRLVFHRDEVAPQRAVLEQPVTLELFLK